MKSCLTVALIFLLVFVLLLGGLAWALRPPFPVIAPQVTESDADIQTALTDYLLERVGLALDDYSGEGALEVTLDRAGLTQVLADALNSQISGLPSAVKFSGVFTDLNQDYVQLGGGFKVLFLKTGVSARMGVQIVDGNLELNLISVHLGRLPLSANFVLNTLGKHIDLPQELAGLSFPATFDLAEDKSVSISGLELRGEGIVFNLDIEDGLIPDIPNSVVSSLEESLPKVNEVLADNPVASEALEEIEAILEQSKAQDKQVNSLKLMAQGQKLYNSLSPQELEQFEEALPDDLKEFLAQFPGR